MAKKERAKERSTSMPQEHIRRERQEAARHCLRDREGKRRQQGTASGVEKERATEGSASMPLRQRRRGREQAVRQCEGESRQYVIEESMPQG